MLVTRTNFEATLDTILALAPKEIALDTETTSIHWWNSPWHPRKPRVFSVQLFFEVDGDEYGYYFDFGSDNSTDDHLDSTHFAILQWKLFSLPGIYWYIQNAKFDMHHLKNHGCELAGDIHCTKVIARVLNNQEGSLKLDDLCEKYFGENKIDVKTKLDELGAITKIKSPYAHDTAKPEDVYAFEKLPLPLLIEYGIRDTALTYKLGKWQRKKIAEKDAEIFTGDETTFQFPDGKTFRRGLTFIMELENRLTKVLFQMERTGAKIDREWCEAAFANEKEMAFQAREHLDAIVTAVEMKNVDWNSNDEIAKVFDAFGISYGTTAKSGKAQFTRYTLEQTDHELAEKILKYRYHYKRAYTYFKNFLELADVDGFIHPDFQPGGTSTGRFSCWNPNLQNIPKRSDKQEKDYPVRRAFVNLGDDYFLYSFDFDQMEYRLMLNYAREEEIAKAIREGGLDVHQAFADSLGLKRDDAKNLNFAVLYGAGIAKIASMIKIESWEATKMRKDYFRKLPGVKSFIDRVRNTAKARGYIFSFMGRVLKFDIETHWRASNHIIQGGCADITKYAMVLLAPLFEGKKSKLFLQVHDELDAYIHKDELELVPQIKKVLETAYEAKLLPLTSGAARSKTAWNELEDDVT